MKKLVLLLCLWSTIGNTQTPDFGKKEFKTDSGETLRYRELVSDYAQNTTYPLVIFLHGSGERGEDNESQLQWGVKHFATSDIMRTHKPVIIAPQCPAGQWWSNLSDSGKLLPTPSTPMKLVLELIDSMIAAGQIDRNRIYITGLSMGGFGTFDALSRRPELFAAALAVCGGGDPNQASKFSSVPLWIAHGAIDDVVPLRSSMAMYEALEQAGAHPGLSVYPETGHFSWVAAYSDPYIMDWLFAQKKN